MDNECIRCHNENPRDYPVCGDCEPLAHFAHRPVCLCQKAECVAKRESIALFTPRDVELARLAGGTLTLQEAA